MVTETKNCVICQNIFRGRNKCCSRLCSQILISNIGKNRVFSEETRRKLSVARRGRVFSEETRRKISIANKGRYYSRETRRKMSSAHKGIPNLRIKGKTYEELYGVDMAKILKDKNSEWHKTNPKAKEILDKMHRINTGKKQSEEVIKNRVKKNTGKKRTEELKNRMSLILKGRELSPEHLTRMVKLSRERLLGKTFVELYGEEKAKVIANKISVSNTGKAKILNGISYQGEIHHCWLGGKSFEPYTFEFTNKFKESIKKRDNYSCQVCNLEESEGSYLQIHHINYNKKLSIPQNCISLCGRCHGSTNYNRDRWCDFFQSMLSERYSYDYEDKKVVITLEGWSDEY